MTRPLVFFTGFEPFADVRVNPSGELARALDGVSGLDVEVRGTLLPVSFERAPDAYAEALAGLDRQPDVLLATGVHRGAAFRLERRARAALDSQRPDNDGVCAAAGPLPGPAELVTRFDLELLASGLTSAGASEVMLSDDAGGYLCERVYRCALEAGERLGVPALFLHVPPIEHVTLEAQLPVVRDFVARLARA